MRRMLWTSVGLTLALWIAAAGPLDAQRSDFDIRDASRHGLRKTYFRDGGALTPSADGAPEDIARAFLRANRSLTIDGLRLTGKDVAGRAVFLSFQQTHDGVDVYN